VRSRRTSIPVDVDSHLVPAVLDREMNGAEMAR